MNGTRILANSSIVLSTTGLLLHSLMESTHRLHLSLSGKFFITVRELLVQPFAREHLV